MIRRLVVPLALVAAAVLVSVPAASSGNRLHISLRGSAPAKDTVLAASPSEIRLWFSGVPRDSATSVRLLNSAGEAVTSVHVMPVTPDPQDGKIQFAAVHGTLAPGSYRIAWATIARDGFNAKGEIPFSVRAP